MARAKGTTLTGFVKFLRVRREQALKVLPPVLHHYLNEPILDSQWYPEEDLLEIIRASAALLTGDRTQILERFGQIAAKDHLEGIYSHLKGNPDVLALPRRVFALFASQHDTGKMKMRITGDKEGVLTLEEFGCPSAEVCDILTGYLREVLIGAGLKNPTVHKKTCIVMEDSICTWSFTWE